MVALYTLHGQKKTAVLWLGAGCIILLVLLQPAVATAQITGTCCGKTVVLSQRGSGHDRCFDCQTFMESGATSWPPEDACTPAGRLSYASRCGVTPDCSSSREPEATDLRQSLCRQLRQPEAPPPPPEGIALPTCVKEALRKALPDSMIFPEALEVSEVNLEKVRVGTGSKPPTKEKFQLQNELLFRAPCSLPFALEVGIKIRQLAWKRRMEEMGLLGEQEAGAGVSEEEERKEVSEALERHYGESGLSCCEAFELPGEGPGVAEVCAEIEPYCESSGEAISRLPEASSTSASSILKRR